MKPTISLQYQPLPCEFHKYAGIKRDASMYYKIVAPEYFMGRVERLIPNCIG